VAITSERLETIAKWEDDTVSGKRGGHARICIDACGAEARIQAFGISWIPA